MSSRTSGIGNVSRFCLVVISMLVLLFPSGLTYGSVYAFLLVQPRVLVSSPPVTLQAGTAGTSFIYTNSTSARVSAVAPSPAPTYYPSGYNVVTGTYVSGAVPSSVQTIDTNYFVVNSSGNPVTIHNPSGYNLIGSTKLVSGTVGNLTLNNAVYMTFRSYVSATSASAKTDAFIAYRSNTGTNTLNSPKNRAWDGDTAAWSGENELATAGSAVRWVRTAICPKSERALEKIVVTLSADGYLDAYMFDGTSWVVTNNIASIWTTAPSNPVRPFDIVYETSSGRALLVYDVNLADSTKDIGYRIWTFGTGWSQEYYIDFTGVASTNPVLSFIKLASNPDSASNQTALAFNDGTNGDAFAAIWSGTAWTKMTTLTTTNTISTRESVNIQYSTYYKKILAVAGNDRDSMVWKTYTQGDADWVAQTAFDPDPDNNNEVAFGTLKRDPAATSTDDYIMYVGVNSLVDLNAFAFDMADTPPSRVNVANEVDDSIDSDTSRPIDFDWEPTGNKGLVVWGTAFAQINYNTYSISAGWGASWTAFVSCGGNNIHPWIQLKSNPRNIAGDIKILGAMLEGTVNDLGAIKWDGTTLTVIGATTFTADTNVATYECFDLKFQLFGDPTEFTNEVEFSGTSNTNNWGKIDWTVDSAWTTGSVAVTLQLYNYTLGNYPTSGNGFISYTSNATANIDQTKTQAITTNPTQFRDASGNWKIKIKGAKTSATQFDLKADWIEFKPTNPTEYTASTEFLFASTTKNTPTQLNFTVVSEYDIVSVSVTIQVWNYSSSPQAYVTSGQGYLTYSSSGANQTKLLSINTSPQFYTSDGNAKIKITGVLTTITQYQQKVNQVRLIYSYNSSPNYNYVLKIVNQVSDTWKIRLRAYSQSNIARLNNCTIYFRNSTDGTSGQIYIISGVYTQQTGPWYDLPSSPAERYIALSLDASNSEVSYVYVYMEILVPNKTTYAQYILTFEIT